MKETDLPRPKHVLIKAQKENLKLGRVIVRKNREEEAKVKLGEVVDMYMKLYAPQETKEDDKSKPEPVYEENTKKEEDPKQAPVEKKTSRPTSSYSTPEESETSLDIKSSLDD